MKTAFRFGLFLLTLVVLCSVWATAPAAAEIAAPAAPAEIAAPTDDPTTFATDMTGYTMYENVMYWFTNPTCPGGGGGPNRAAEDPVTIKRRRSAGGDTRTLFSHNPTRPAGTCNPYNILSNLAIDGDYLYWLDSAGLRRLPTTAIPGDPLDQIVTLANSGGEVVDGGPLVYFQIGGVIRSYDKTSGAVTVVYGGNPAASSLQYDGVFLYYKASGALKVLNPANNHAIIDLFPQVDSYHAPGYQTVCGDDSYQWTVSYGAVGGYQYLNYAINPPDTLRFGDFNGDGKTDVFSTLPRAGGGHQWVYSSGGVAGYLNGAWDYADPSELRFGDFNGDGKTDVFHATPSGGGYQWRYSPGAVNSYVNLTGASTPPEDLRFGNFVGDNKTDVFTVIDGGGGLLSWVVSNAGTGAYTTINAAGAPLDQLAFADFNNDGKTDVFRAVDLNNGLFQWQYSSAGAGAWVNLRQEPYGVNDVAFGDFVGDDRADVFVTDLHPAGAYQWRASDAGLGALQNLAYAHGLADLDFGDFDGNGRTDAFVAQSRDFCRTLLPVFYAYKETSTFANAFGIGGRVRWHDLNTGANGTLYLSDYELFGQSDAFAYFNIYDSVATTDKYYFFAEKFKHYCFTSPGCFVTPTRTTLQRMTLTRDVFKGYVAGAPALLYLNERTYSTPNDILDMEIANDEEFLHWRDYRNLLQLSVNAAALPRINLRVTGIEVTQGLQNATNSIRLIRGKDTTVRVFVRSDGANVPNVQASLRVFRNGVLTSVLNARGPITVRGTPDNFNLGHQFLFNLPLYLTDGNNIRVEAVLNPLGYPLEPVGMTADNVLSSATLTMNPSPTLEVIFVEFAFDLNGARQVPLNTGRNATWIGRAYPLGYIPVAGGYDFGLDWSTWEIDDANLAARVDWRMATCANDEDDPTPHVCAAYYSCDASGNIIDTDAMPDNRNLCASDYVNGRLTALRSQRAIGADPFLYGEIRDTGVTGQFPRGQAGVGRSSSGPDGVGWIGYYAGHEVGHTAALGHPLQADGQCGIDGSDPVPSHPNATVGPAGDTVNGLTLADLDGDGRWEPTLLRGSQWFDFMGYCNSSQWPHQWVSDQNYERMYTNLSARRSPEAVLQAGDWLAVIGSIAGDSSSAVLTVAERWDAAVLPPAVTGEFGVRLRGAGGGLLAATAFSAPVEGDSGRRPFALVVPFVAGTRTIQIISLLDNVIIAERTISANVPTISNVTVAQNGSNVDIGWTASDADGDALHFDIYISHDAGATFKPLALGQSGNSAQLPLSQTGGGDVIVQVQVSDGVQTATANSPTTALTVQPPEIVSVEPDCSQPVAYGEPVNFSASVIDAQDGALTNNALAWYRDGQFEGYGAVSFSGNLRTGLNTITLIATNSYGIFSYHDCVLFVGDDQTNPQPQLSVAPPLVEWLADGNARAVQTAALALTNVAEGTLNWSATSSHAWLLLDADAGSAPATLTVSADPAGMAPGSINQASVTLLGLDSNGNVTNEIVVPVTLWVDHPGYLPPIVGTGVPTALGLAGLRAVAPVGGVALVALLLLVTAVVAVRARRRGMI